MVTSIGVSGAPYGTTKIPELSDNADIQTALRLYHYGEESANPSTLLTDSMAGFLKSLDDRKIEKTPEGLSIDSDLNLYTVTGNFQQAGIPVGLSYPTPLSPGMLSVIANEAGTTAFQVFHSTSNIKYWRIRTGGSWTSWKAENSHTHSASNITDPANITSGKIYSGGVSGGTATRIYIQETAPTGATAGDLWFW